jgi:hypothetical protein
MKYIITESQYNKAIGKFISQQFRGYEVATSPAHPKSIYWIKDGVVIAEINGERYFWVHKDIWDTISDMFSLGPSSTGYVISDWLEKHYGLVLIPDKAWPATIDVWRHIKTLKN